MGKSAEVASFASICEIVSATISAATKAPEWALDKEESEQLGAALKNVADMYPVQISDKAAAWGNLGLTALIMFGPRAYITYDRLQKEREERARNVTPPPPSNEPFTPQETGEAPAQQKGGITVPSNVAFW